MTLEGSAVVGLESGGESGAALKSVALSRGALLAIFGSNHKHAEERYLALFQKLVRYFGWNGTADPEDQAQEALLRGFRRLHQGQQVTAQNPESYFFGIARNLVRESWNVLKDEPYPGREPEPDLLQLHNLNRVEQLVFLKECLRDLPRDDLEMLMAYLQGGGETWAREAGLQPSTIRSRVHRTRKRLTTLTMHKHLKSSPVAGHCDPDRGSKKQAKKKSDNSRFQRGR